MKARLVAIYVISIFGFIGVTAMADSPFRNDTNDPGFFGADYFVRESEDELLIFFWGTNTHEERRSYINLRSADFRGIRAHSGWLSYYLTVREYVFPLVQQAFQDSKRIHITGYSMGAAFATYLTYEAFLDIPNATVQLETWGSPRVVRGRVPDFDKWSNAVRHVLWLDFVTLLPPAILGYRHIGTRNVETGTINPFFNHPENGMMASRALNL